jgi:hypothetical protein
MALHAAEAYFAAVAAWLFTELHTREANEGDGGGGAGGFANMPASMASTSESPLLF